jgi:hypothetical protein
MTCECGTPAHYIAKGLCRACYQCALKAANPEHYKEIRLRWQTKNQKKRAEQSHAWYIANKEQVAFRTASYRKENPERTRGYWKAAWTRPEVRYKKYRASANRLGVPFTLSLDEFVNLVCTVCAYGDGVPDATIILGVDRKDSLLGYDESNCVPCCTFHNFAKWRFLNYNQMRAAMDVDQIPCSNIRPTQRRAL